MQYKVYTIGISIISIIIVLKSFYDLFQFLFVGGDSLFLLCVSIVNLVLAIGLLLRIKVFYKIFYVYAYAMLILSSVIYTIFIFGKNNFNIFDATHIVLFLTLLFWFITSVLVKKCVSHGEEQENNRVRSSY